MKRTLALLAVTVVLLAGLAWSISAIQELRSQVAQHQGRIELLERG